MAVGVIACQLAVVYPDDALGTECLQQPLLYLLAGHWLVAVGRQEALGGSENGAAAIAFDAASLEYEVELVDVLATQATFIVEAAVDGIVELGRELLSPAVELEVEQADAPLVADERQEPVVAGPCVVGGTLDGER